MTDEEKAAAAEEAKKEGDKPSWAIALIAQVEALTKSGGDLSVVQKIPPTTASKTEEEKKVAEESKESKSDKKGFLGWLL